MAINFILIVFFISGLVRNDFHERNATTPRSFNYGILSAGTTALESSMESENTDEEKAIRDNSTSEKLKFAFMANSLIVSIRV